MKILFYYWIQYNDKNSRGGGVQVYLRNVIEGLRNKENVQIYTLSSGTAYNLSGKCYIERLPDDQNVRRYQVVNSPMLAPSKTSFFDQKIYTTDIRLKRVLLEFINEIGGVDVIHFQSLEGLTLKCLEIKKDLSHVRLILSLHNYQIFCPQVNLWKHNSISCDNFHGGRDCLTCLGTHPETETFKKYYLFDYYLRKMRLERYSRDLMNKAKILYRLISRDKKLKSSIAPGEEGIASSANDFFYMRTQNVKMINRYVDHVLCVSNRVKQIALDMGVDQNIVVTNYIGTKFAAKQKFSSAYPFSGKILTIAYMGYMRRDKGFFFLLDALDRLPEDVSKRLAVVIAARFDDMLAVKKINELKTKFADVRLYNGYVHSQILEITRGVHLGIVPVLWEDNLPQVAIEFKAMGIPVLASNRGGASELSGSQYFIFKSGNYQDFKNRLINIIRNPSVFGDYWDKQLPLKDMNSHIYELMGFYDNANG